MNRLDSILAEAQLRFDATQVSETIDWLAKELATSFDEASLTGRLAEFQASCRKHPLCEYFMMDPYSRRAAEKPRGYAGDAVMLDFIYRPDPKLFDGVAGSVHRATTTLPNAKSVLWRRDYLASLIFSRMRPTEAPRILSVASGHMRELDTLRDLTESTKVEFTALDQDKTSIQQAIQTYNEYKIVGIPRGFSSLIKRNSTIGNFHVIYSAGLFDYLTELSAVSLVKAMFARLLPGGVLSIGNFTRDSHGRGFMAGFMDWCLIYRNEGEMRALAQAACPGASYRIFRDQPGNVVYLEIFSDKAIDDPS
ncbi:hypothetical protein [Methylobacterium iners]|uniref:Class I SAM-dependent methyltransferase n=1 Tax=Methylobacterium iners TaxID=418707 RepID=A0ABQ4RWN9_9HYPH|nr:hypothetical protein [Methylobacterium iners]GJD94002.1 hypothetical protein OCOJLMKI_1200 [Methylobacterium iners]